MGLNPKARLDTVTAPTLNDLMKCTPFLFLNVLGHRSVFNYSLKGFYLFDFTSIMRCSSPFDGSSVKVSIQISFLAIRMRGLISTDSKSNTNEFSCSVEGLDVERAKSKSVSFFM